MQLSWPAALNRYQSLPQTRTRQRLAPLLRSTAMVLGVGANLVIVLLIVQLMMLGQNQADWASSVEAGRRAWHGEELYDWQRGVYEFRYSPILAYAFGAIAPIGLVGWRLVSAASLLLLPRRMAAIAAISIPFWLDLYAGNVMTPIFVIAALAIAGRSWAIGAFFVVSLLVPKPALIPVLAWLLWRYPDWRLRFALIAILEAGAVIASGSAVAWASSIINGQYEIYAPFDLGPARVIGLLWIPIGLFLAVWLTRRGRLGYASLAASPYWLPYYLILLLLELVPKPRSFARVRTASPALPTRNHVGK